MGCSLDPPSRGEGEGSRFLLVSDPHLHWQDDADEVVDDIETYLSEYGCDELLVGGDTGALDEVDALLEGDQPFSRVVAGNHDNPNGTLPDGDYRYEDELSWTADGYAIRMVHDPRDHGLRATKDQFTGSPPDADILIYGHSHMPYVRDVAGRAVIGAGSLYTNYNMSEDVPQRSLHLIDIRHDTVTVSHLDYDTGAVVEQVVFRYDDGFVETCAEQAWTGDRFVI